MSFYLFDCIVNCSFKAVRRAGALRTTRTLLCSQVQRRDGIGHACYKPACLRALARTSSQGIVFTVPASNCATRRAISAFQTSLSSSSSSRKVPERSAVISRSRSSCESWLAACRISLKSTLSLPPHSILSDAVETTTSAARCSPAAAARRAPAIVRRRARM